MRSLSSVLGLTESDKKQLAGITVWFAAGIGMIVMGIFSIVNSAKTVSAISGLLGMFALAAGIFTLAVRIFQKKTIGTKRMGLDFLIWFVLAFLLFNTSLLSKLGKIAFIIIGVLILLSSVRNLMTSLADNSGKPVGGIVFSALLAILGIFVISKAESIFNNMLAIALGVYLIIHGLIITYEWIGRVRYFRNFRGVEND